MAVLLTMVVSLLKVVQQAVKPQPQLSPQMERELVGMEPQPPLEQQLVLLVLLWVMPWVVLVVRVLQQQVVVLEQHQQQQSLVVVAAVPRQLLPQQAVLLLVLVGQDKLGAVGVPLQLAQRLRLELSPLEMVALDYSLEVRGHP
jgi:hypothetical protein